MKAIQVWAMIATGLVIATGVHQLTRPPGSQDGAKRSRAEAARKKRAAAREAPCTIKHAAFGGTQSALLKVMKGRTVHYVVLDLPTGNPIIPELQSQWLDATYGQADAKLIDVFPTIDAAVARAASLCRRN
jgi:hypothetical protein